MLVLYYNVSVVSRPRTWCADGEAGAGSDPSDAHTGIRAQLSVRRLVLTKMLYDKGVPQELIDRLQDGGPEQGEIASVDALCAYLGETSSERTGR